MTRPPRYSWLTLALLALAGLAPSTARASCGHYVQIGSSLQDKTSQADKAARTDKLAGAEHPMPVPSSPGKKPCSGPGCSQGGQPLLPVPTTTPTIEEERWGTNPLGIQPTEHPTGILPFFSGATRPVRPALSIFHPPR